MHFKLIVAFVEDSTTDAIMEAAREAGATGCTVIPNARGEGIEESKTFFGLTLSSQRDVVLLLSSGSCWCRCTTYFVKSPASVDARMPRQPSLRRRRTCHARFALNLLRP